MSTTRESAFTIRPIDASESELFRATMGPSFGFDPVDEDIVPFRKMFEFDRSICAFDGDTLVGTCGAFSFELTVPGGRALPMGGTTVITVLPTHRRRGALRAMMAAHIDEMVDRGEPLAGLWASESSIYGRFGYGVAAIGCVMTIDAASVRFIDDSPSGRVRLIESDEVMNRLPTIFDRVRPTRPGMYTRSKAWWEHRVLYDPEHRRSGMTANRYAVYEGPDGPEGYCIFRQKAVWGDYPAGELAIREMIAATPDAHSGLWRFLLSMDLFPKVRYQHGPPDDELPHRIADSRRVQQHPTDSLWIRLLDVPAALAGRGYDAAERLTFRLRDAFRPENDGVYVLDATAARPICDRTDATAVDLELPADVLGAVYLGGQSLGPYVRAGRVACESHEVLQRADRLFMTTGQRAPWCHEVF